MLFSAYAVNVSRAAPRPGTVTVKSFLNTSPFTSDEAVRTAVFVSVFFTIVPSAFITFSSDVDHVIGVPFILTEV